MENNRSGFENENELFKALNGKYFTELNDNLKAFISFIIGNNIPKNQISVTMVGGTEKCDLKINIDNTEYSISIKKGGGNSVHQEPVNTFVEYLKENYSISNDLADDILFFVWGDGTLDGTGKKENRLSASEIATMHPGKINSIKDFFKTHKRELIQRFLLKGVFGNEIYCIYHGDSGHGLWASSEEVLELLCDKNFESSSAAVPVGGLTFQAWNRAIGNTEDSTEGKRGVVQLKWGKLEKHLEVIKSRRSS
jgi:hypothetical protein